MDLRISTTYPLIGVSSTPGKLEIEQQPASFEVKHGKVDLTVQPSQAELVLDMKPFHNAIGLKPFTDMGIQYWSGKSQRLVQEATARTARQGDRLMNIHLQGNGLAEVARDEAEPREDPAIIADYTSLHIPQMSIQGESYPKISVNSKVLEIETMPNWARIKASRYEIDIYMIQKENIEIEYVGTIMDFTI